MNFAADSNPIKAFAKRGETSLSFPSSHPTSRFATAQSTFALLGKFGDAVDFRNLPTSVQNAEVARLFGALVEGDLSESCGSPGEVSNNPLEGYHFGGDSDLRGYEGPHPGGHTSDWYTKGPHAYHGHGDRATLTMCPFREPCRAPAGSAC